MNYEEYLLTHLIEECSEVIKTCTKIQRFGREHFWVKEDCHNSVALATEIGDVMCLVEKLKLIGYNFYSSKIDREERFNRALALSIKLGRVHDDGKDTVVTRPTSIAVETGTSEVVQPPAVPASFLTDKEIPNNLPEWDCDE